MENYNEGLHWPETEHLKREILFYECDSWHEIPVIIITGTGDIDEEDSSEELMTPSWLLTSETSLA